MRTRLIRLDAFRRRDSKLRTVQRLTPGAWVLACLAVATVPFTADVLRAFQTPANPLANPTADANRYLEDSMKRQNNQKEFEKLNVQRQKDMALETAKLLALANELKAEADRKSNSNLSMNAVREAEQIEKLAHSVREKMKATVGN